MPPKHPTKLRRFNPADQLVTKKVEEPAKVEEPVKVEEKVVEEVKEDEVEVKADTGLFCNGKEFETLEINGRLKEGILGQGFKHLTNVQAEAFTPIMADRDVLIKSATGSGKTMAYMLPLVEKVLRWTETNRIDRSYGTLGIIMVPTRELAEQCHSVLQKTVQKISFLVCGCVMGGEQRKKEKARLRAGVHFLIATVGRLLDHLRTTEAFNVSTLTYLVLDEADRLLDMGYESDITTIKQLLAQKQAPLKQSILVSATLDEGIKKLSHFILRDPIIVGGTLDDEDRYQKLKADKGDAEEEEEEDEQEQGPLATPDCLTQHYALIPTKLRLVCLLSFLKWKVDQTPNPTVRSTAVRERYVLIPVKQQGAAKEGVKIIVFMSSADSVEFHYKMISDLTVRSLKKHPLRKKESASDKAERRKDAKMKKGSQKRKLNQANAHLDHDDEEGYVEFSDEDEEEDDENIEGGEAGWEPFISCDLFKLHGNMGQIDRTSIYESFKRCTNGILLATDVASRGLDMPGINWVVQYDPALDRKSYTHRIGRTARAGKAGDAVTFIQTHEEPYIAHLTKTMSIHLNKMTQELMLFQLSKFLKENHLLEAAARMHSYCERAATNDYELRRLAAVAYQAYLRAYSTYPKDVMHIFNVKNMHLGHVARSFAIMKNPTNLNEITHEGQDTRGSYEPTLVRKSKLRERHSNNGMTLREAEDAAAKKAFRKPIATSRVGQFNEFASGNTEIDNMGNQPIKRTRK
eukprot:TRINITY_DN24232_c0_g1_i1.p1 TRINITY_DN24232_c0_g1~~TRINITY_DN24232_c0_g1_i1.p1  ORF type:complete len:746 (+),score=258.72 TRINITY_DN24232_c0_g1_i1:46-2283(+)